MIEQHGNLEFMTLPSPSCWFATYVRIVPKRPKTGISTISTSPVKSLKHAGTVTEIDWTNESYSYFCNFCAEKVDRNNIYTTCK